VISLSRRDGLSGLIRLAFELSRSDYTHIYDAHSNLRSSLFVMMMRVLSWRSRFVVRPKSRVRRFLFFKFRMRSVLPRPFRAADSYHRPLAKWGLPEVVPDGPQFHVSPGTLPSLPERFIALAASAAWEMKRWPVEHWQELIRLMPENSFVLLGGPGDSFLSKLEGPRVSNLAGRLSLVETSRVIAAASLVISNDTGSLQVADQMERPTIALIGPTAFGYPSHATSIYLEKPLWCQPCSKDGRGGCVNDLYKRCLVELTPQSVAAKARALIGET
jgi:ADP-heptose:LPS heptosyltransferase